MKKLLLIILIFSLFICGCQSENEINNLSIVNAIGIDIDDNEYKVSIQILDVNKTTNDEQEKLNKSITYTSKGSNISEALNNITLKSPKSLYLGHLELVVISEKLAKSNISKITDYFLRNSNISKNFTMLISKDCTPEDVLNILESDSNFPTGNILGSIEVSSTSEGTSNNIKFIQFMQDLTSEGKNPILPTIKKNDKDKLIIDNVALFKNQKLKGYLNSDGNIAYNFITDNIKSSNINYKCDKNNYIGINITKSNTKMKSSIKNNKPIIYLNVSANAEIIEVNCSSGIDDLSKVKKEVENKIKNMINNVIRNTKEDYKSDIFGFGQNIYKNHLSYWKKIKKEWEDKYYPDLEVHTNVEVKLDNQGSILETAR